MPTLNEKLAGSLTRLMSVGNAESRRIFRSSELSRTDRERLMGSGFLREIVPGWLMTTSPEEAAGETTSWYASFWEFCRAYLDDRFGEEWVLSPEASISYLAEDGRIPAQIVVRAPGGNNGVLNLPHNTSIFAYRSPLPASVLTDAARIRTFTPDEALAGAAPRTWATEHGNIVALLGSIRGSASLLRPLLRDGNVAAAGRLAGALSLLGRPEDGDRIVTTMKNAGHNVRSEANPFDGTVPILLGKRPEPPVVTRIRLMWAQMRDQVLAGFPDEPSEVADIDAYVDGIDSSYTSDAYHSLSIEGYVVSADLIERIRRGDYDRTGLKQDMDEQGAIAAKGYHDAHGIVRDAVIETLRGADAVDLFASAHQDWYAALFQPRVAAGLMRPEELAGYRHHGVSIRGSTHRPPSWESVPDAMDAFVECMRSEEDARVRAILGHFIFTFIHPLHDGNGRCGRFLMNLMLASGGYPWTIIPVDRRADYMSALEAASATGDIGPFTQIVVDCIALEPPPPRRLLKGEEQALRDPTQSEPDRDASRVDDRGRAYRGAGPTI